MSAGALTAVPRPTAGAAPRWRSIGDAEARAVALVRARASLRRALAAIAGRLVARRAWERLGFARLADYARERPGLSARSLQDLAHVDAALERLPAIEAALGAGTLSWTRARLLCRVAQPEDEERWIAYARTVTAATLAREVRAVDLGAVEAGALGAGADGAEEAETACVVVRCSSRVQGLFHRSRWLARRAAGEQLPSWGCMEAVAAEGLSALGIEDPIDAPDEEAADREPDLEQDHRERAREPTSGDPSRDIGREQRARRSSDDAQREGSREPCGGGPHESAAWWVRCGAAAPRGSPQPASASGGAPQRASASAELAAPSRALSGEATPTLSPERFGEATPTLSPERSGEATPALSPERFGRATPAPSPERFGEATPALSPERFGGATPALSPEQFGEATPAPGGPVETRLPEPARSLLGGLADADAFELDARLGRAVALEQRLEADLAPLVLAVAEGRLHRRRGFLSLEAWARERLGVSPRKLRALLRLARAGERWPALAGAFRDGRLSWVRAHAVLPALVLAESPADARAWLARAASLSVRRLEEEVDAALLADAERRAGDAQGERQIGAPHRGSEESAAPGMEAPLPPREREEARFLFFGPVPVARLFRAVLCSARRHLERARGRPATEGEAAGWLFEHAIGTWLASELADARLVRAHRVFARDGWRCTVPGCTNYRNLHDHHVRFRSAGGSDALANRTTLCAFHHLRGVHAGRVRITGRAPDRLRFELGLRPGRPPLVRYDAGEAMV